MLVTAAAGTGIGFATARRCVEEGATVVLSDAHERRLGEAADELAPLAGARPLTFVCDVTVEAQVQAMVDGTVAEHGRVDVVVNNAGLGGTADLVDMLDEQWHKVLDITLTGTMRCTRATLRQMYGQDAGGVIVNNASVLGWRAQAGQAHYAAAKAGVMALTRSRGHRGRAPRRARQRGGPVARHARRSWPRSRPTSCSTSSRSARPSGGPPSRGRSPP